MKTLSLYSLIFFCVLSCKILQAQRYQVEVYNDKNGLVSRMVKSVYQSRDGLLWIGTKDGLHSYNGYRFQLYNTSRESPVPLTDNEIHSIFQDSLDRLWLGTNNGLNIIDYYTGQAWYYFNVDNRLFPAPEGNSRVVKEIKLYEHRPLFLLGGALWQAESDRFRQLLPGFGEPVADYELDADGNIIIVTPDLQKIIFNGRKEELQPRVRLEFPKSNPSLMVDDRGRVVLTNAKFDNFFALGPEGYSGPVAPDSIFIADPIRFVVNEIIPASFVPFFYDHFIDPNGLIWLASSWGLIKLTPQRQFFKTIGRNFSFRGLFQSQDGQIYGGAYDPGSFFRIDPHTDRLEWLGICPDVYDLAPLGKDHLLLTIDGGGMAVVNKDNRQYSSYFKDMTFNGFLAILSTEQGNFWIGNMNNLYRTSTLDPLQIHPYQTRQGQQPFKGHNILDLASGNDETIWVGTQFGLFQIHQDAGVISHYRADGPAERRLSDNLVRQILPDRNYKLWVATNGGLNLVDTKKGLIRAFTTQHGLCHNSIFSILKQNERFLWLGTENGLSRLDLKDEKFENFFPRDGISHREFNTNSYLLSSTGKIYLGTINGITVFDPAKVKSRTAEFHPMISHYEKWDRASKGIQRFNINPAKIQPIVLHSDDRFIEFYFTNSDLTNPSKNLYSCYLEGFDKEWLMLGSKDNIRYTNLNAGRYVFHLKSANSSGIWSDDQVSIPMTVNQAWYRLWWFWGGIFLLILLVISAVYQMRLNQQKRIQRLRNRIANDLHDEMSNTLNNIRIIAQEESNNGASQRRLRKIRHLSTEAVDYLQDTIWSINRQYSQANDLLFKMQDAVDDILRDKGFPVHFTTSELDLEMRVPFLNRRNILLIFKEAISNIVKHTQPEEVKIHLSKIGDSYKMEITNRYTRKRKPEFSTGKGLKSMQQRADAIGARLAIKDGDGQFTVQLELQAPN